jgi:intracellular septation protein
MQALLEFSPLLAFMAAYYLRDLYFATGVLMVAMLALLAVDYLLTRRIPRMHLLSTILVLVFGAATLILRNAQFIQWKPTIFMWIVAVAFLLSGLAGREPLAQRFLRSAAGEQELPRALWLRLNTLWVVFYALAGLANILVARTLSERTWVNFKVIGLTAATLVFVVLQALWLARRAEAAVASAAPKP